MNSKPTWRLREDALVNGAPLLIIPALGFVPITISLLIDPAFRHARLLGLVLVPLFYLCEFAGLSRLAHCFRCDFDVLTLLAAGMVIVFWVIAACSGVLLAIVISRF